MPLIPQTIRHSLERLDISLLCEIRDFIEQLIREGQQPRRLDDQLNEEGTLQESGSGVITYRLEMVSCGKKCKGCPHGPYWYGYWREGNRTRSKYIGKNLRQKS